MNDLDRTALLAAIKDAPADDLPRLAYADWLEEHGDDDRANFIRTQLEMAKLPEGSLRRNQLERKADALLARHKEWEEAFRELDCIGMTFKRGFVDSITISAHNCINHAARLAAMPHLNITVTDAQWNLSNLAQAPYIDQLPRLGLECSYEQQSRHFPHFVTWPQFAQLKELSCHNIEAIESGDEMVHALARSPHLKSLTRLHLKKIIYRDSALALASSPNLARLEKLELPCNWLSEEDAIALMRSAYLGNLTHLDLSVTRITDAVIEALCEPTCRIKKLTSLKLSVNPITDNGIRALAQSPNFQYLNELNISHPRPTDARSDASMIAIAQSPYLNRLTKLDAGYSNISGQGITALADSANSAQLTSLELLDNNITQKGAMAIAQSPHLAQLEYLGLAYNKIDDKGALALIKGLPNLLQLKLYGNPIGEHTKAEINRILKARSQEHAR